MTVSFHGSHAAVGGEKNSWTFEDVDIGPPASDRRVMIGYALSGSSNATPSITVNGTAATQVLSAAAGATVRVGVMRVHLPEGSEAEVVATSGGNILICFSVWRVTGTPNTVETEGNVMTTDGSRTETLTTVDGGIALGVQFRSSGDPGWIGLEERDTFPFAGFIFSSADLAPTDGDPLLVGVAFVLNINSRWAAGTFSGGGTAGVNDINASLAADVGVNLAAAGSGDGGDGGDGDPHVIFPRACPHPGLGSEACVTGRTTLPPGYGQILCGQAEYEDPCD